MKTNYYEMKARHISNLIEISLTKIVRGKVKCYFDKCDVFHAEISHKSGLEYSYTNSTLFVSLTDPYTLPEDHISLTTHEIVEDFKFFILKRFIKHFA